MTQVLIRSQACTEGRHGDCDGWGYVDGRQARCKCGCRHFLSPERVKGLARNRELFDKHLSDKRFSISENFQRYLDDPERYVDTYKPQGLEDRLGWPEEDPPDPATWPNSPVYPVHRSGVV